MKGFLYLFIQLYASSLTAVWTISISPTVKMKLIYLFFGVALLGLTAAASDCERSKDTCRLAQLVPSGSIIVPELDIDEDKPPVPQDPLFIPNTTVVLKEETLNGTYSLRNGVVVGLSTMEHHIVYNALFQRLSLNMSLKHVRLTGDYEIINGKANLPEVGEHAFSGSGPLNASAAGVKASATLNVRLNLTTGYVSIDKLKFNLTFDSADIVAENLIVDGEPVNWEFINQMIKPMFDALVPDAQELITEKVQEKINWLLEGCTLKDLVDIFVPHAPPPPQ